MQIYQFLELHFQVGSLVKLVQMLNWSMYTQFYKKIIISDGYGQSFQLGHVVGLICACT